MKYMYIKKLVLSNETLVKAETTIELEVLSSDGPARSSLLEKIELERRITLLKSQEII